MAMTAAMERSEMRFEGGRGFGEAKGDGEGDCSGGVLAVLELRRVSVVAIVDELDTSTM